MSLKLKARSILDTLRSGGRINRAEHIEILSALIESTPDSTPYEYEKNANTASFQRKESTPVRFQAANWTLTCCKRCGEKGAPDGDWIVRIFGVGWWHDACYRAVNPDFYVGL